VEVERCRRGRVPAGLGVLGGSGAFRGGDGQWLGSSDIDPRGREVAGRMRQMQHWSGMRRRRRAEAARILDFQASQARMKRLPHCIAHPMRMPSLDSPPFVLGTPSPLSSDLKKSVP